MPAVSADARPCSSFPDLHERNLVVPIVGDFAGPTTIRTVAACLNERDATVAAFYHSNVEYFLEGVRNRLCANAAVLPIDESSALIRSALRDDMA